MAAPEAPGPAEEDAGRTIPLAFGFAVMPGICAAFLASGWFVDMELNPMAAVVLALVGTPIAGWVAGRDLVDRVFATLAAAVTAVGIVMATAWYVRGRHASGNFELLLPMLLGALPGLGALLAFRALAPRPLPRVAAAVAALVATVVVIAAY